MRLNPDVHLHSVDRETRQKVDEGLEWHAANVGNNQ